MVLFYIKYVQLLLYFIKFLDQYFVDNGVLYQKPQNQSVQPSNNTLEFNFLDPTSICCGLCGEIVPYETLLDEHLPEFHPEVLNDGVVDLEEIPYEVYFTNSDKFTYFLQLCFL